MSTESSETLADATTGAIVTVVDSAKKPGGGTARRSVRRLARKGEPVNTQLRRRATRTTNEAASAAADILSGNLAERMALQGIRILKDRARRQDMVGDVLNRGLEVISTALDGTARELGKFGAATQPPVRNGARRTASAGRGTAARRSPSTRSRRAATTATKRAGASARRATTRTRSAARTAARRAS